MQPDERQELEQRIHELCTQGELKQAVETALAGYGPELRKLLRFLMGDEEKTKDAFNLFAETLLKNLMTFRWESSFRTWAFRVARNVGYRLRQSPIGREQHASESALDNLPSPERSDTRPWLRTDVKDRFRALRAKLEPEEQRILELRVDQRLPWTDVVRALAAPGEALTPALISQRSAAIRQHFQRIKTRLRLLAHEDELISRDSMAAH